MTKAPKEREALDRLADALVDDILNTSDEDILAESAEDSDDPAKIVEKMQVLFERSALEEAKARLADAKKAAVAAGRESGTVVSIDAKEARRRYESIIAKDSALARKLTMAARKGEGQSERDIDHAIEDLSELGAFDDDETEG